MNNYEPFDLFDDSQILLDEIATLDRINYEIARLQRDKQKLEADIAVKLHNIDDGSKSYVAAQYKVTITTGYNYGLNKDDWEIYAAQLPECFNPVRQKVAYELDKKIIKDCEKYGSEQDLYVLSQMMVKKPKKLHVKIGAAC